MLHAFNKKELCVTFDQKRKNKIIEILSLNNIEYTYYTKDARSTSRASRGHATTLDGNTQFYNKCTFYVHKKDYEHALHLIGGWI